MANYVFKTIILFFIGCSSCLNCAGQIKGDKLRSLLAEVREDKKLVAACEQKAREYQIAKFGRALPKLSGHCWDGCPTSIVLPYYPREARRLGISGQVKVETIVGENGKVVYARVIKGLPFLSQAAERAASHSSYTPQKTCGDKSIKFRWTITYNFYFNRGALKITTASNKALQLTAR
ncbi:MAG TPA: energy transducer TonB [Pyrinomonadaceae bacterium]|jgi:TonB family protein